MARDIVYLEPFGGLGNQLFQYCAAYVTARVHSGILCINECTTNHHNHKKTNYTATLFLDASECRVPPSCVTFHHVPSPFAPWSPQAVLLPCRLDGYFQYYPPLHLYLPELIPKLRNALHVNHTTNAVMLHVRRGDYVEKSHIHYLQGPDYYYAAYTHLNWILQALPPKVLVFSDDIHWCKGQQWIQAIPNVDFYENDNELETLAEMARCGGGAIIANSTFSWWGAMLSQTPYVYYPSRWIAMPIENLFPSHWTCI